MAHDPTSLESGARPTVLVIGMGDTGVLTAGHLSRHCRVIGVTTKPMLVSGQELGLRLTEDAQWRRNYLTPLDHYRRLRRVEIIHGRAARIDPIARTASLELASGEQRCLNWDYLIIASGVSNGFWRDDRLDTCGVIESRLASQRAAVTAAKSIAVVGGGPSGTSAAFNLKRAYPNKSVTLFFPAEELLPGYPQSTRRYHRELLARQGVDLHAGHRAVVSDDLVTSDWTGGRLDFAGGQPSARADLIIWAAGRLKPHTDFLPRDMLNPAGFVRTDACLNVAGYARIFAIGDVAATDPLRCSARNWAYKVLCRNLLAKMKQRALPARFTPPSHRWGSIVGPQSTGLKLHSPSGKSRVLPRWFVHWLLYPLVVRGFIYGGVRSKGLASFARDSWLDDNQGR
ncbi:MAG: FAD-dependent oxidoreductase [Luminiphilus sp.]|nr:FAD-dependent oxidoreductase [Luminiphilus sp.]